MRLLFNATNIRSEGGVILMRHLLEGFLACQPDMQIVLYLNPELVERMAAWLEDAARIKLVAFRPQGSLGRFFWEQVKLPRLCRRQNIDVLFSFGNTGPLFPGCRQILYLQQSIPYTDFTPSRHRFRWWYFQRLYGFLIGLAQRGSSRIVVPTPWLVEPLRKSIGYQKPDSAYCVSAPGIPDMPEIDEQTVFSPAELALIEKLERWKASDIQILLYPCYLAPYKNIPYLLKAVKILEDRQPPPFRLLLTFDRHSREYFPCRDEVFARLDQNASDKIVLIGSQSRLMMAKLYRLADILVFPSLVETLGLPLLEAMSQGRAVVAVQSDHPQARQANFAQAICQDAACYAPPDDPVAFADQLEALLKDADRCWNLGQKGLERAKAFPWEKHIREILQTEYPQPKTGF